MTLWDRLNNRTVTSRTTSFLHLKATGPLTGVPSIKKLGLMENFGNIQIQLALRVVGRLAWVALNSLQV